MRKYVTIPVSSGRAGINRFDPEAAAGQLAEGLNVINDDGDLRRRDGFVSQYVAHPHLISGVATLIFTDQADAGPVVVTDGNFTYTNPAWNRIYIGSAEVFDAILWGSITSAITQTTKNLALRAYYYNGTTWSELPFHRDATIHRTAGSEYAATLQRSGMISFHRTQHASDWATTSKAGVTGYWIRVDVWDQAAGAAATFDAGTVTAVAPGVRVGQLQPVNGLMPVRIRGASHLIIGSDRSIVRALESGAQLSTIKNAHATPEELRLVAQGADEGAGVFDRKEWPTWNDPATGSGNYIGTNGNKLTKADQSYAWFRDAGGTEPIRGQFIGAALQEGLTAGGASTASSFDLSGLTGPSPAANEYEHCILRCTTGSGGGIAVGEQRRILPHVAGTTLGTVAFAAAPDGVNRFAILRPPAKVKMIGINEPMTVDQHASDHVLDLISDANQYTEAVPSEHGLDASLDAGPDVFFEAGWGLRWMHPSGERWSHAYDPVTQRLLMANGAGPVLAFDGIRLRILGADSTSEKAKFLAGELPSQPGEPSDPSGLAASKFLQKPPRAKYLVNYATRIACVEGADEVVWSFPGGANDVWPRLYRQRLRDSEGMDLTGIATLRDRLVAFTPSAIFASGPPNPDGQMAFRQEAEGIGFTAHHAVSKVALSGAPALVGPGPDGLYLWTGAEPRPILDRWDRLIPGGVNERALHRAVACTSYIRNWYMLAVAAAGSRTNNRIIVWDWARNAFWLWDAPYGAEFLAVDRDPAGREKILIGTSDGHVMTLKTYADDDGTALTSTARTPAVRPFGAHEGKFVAVMATLKAMGTVTPGLAAYVDERTDKSLDGQLTANAGDALWGTAVWDTGLWSDHRMKTVRANLPEGMRGHQVQLEINGGSPWRLRSLELMARPLGRRGS